MRFFEQHVWVEAARQLLFALVLGLSCFAVSAHKSSDSYLQVEAAPGELGVRWDIALRDLDVALDLDTNADGKLSWGEVKAALPRIESYAMSHMSIPGCQLRVDSTALEHRNDGTYVVLNLSAPCDFGATSSIAYSLFAEVDPTHRGIVKIQRPGRPVALLVLDPTDRKSPSAVTAPLAARPARWQFLREGIEHILTGYDHVLFLICLLLPAVMRRKQHGWQPVEKLSNAVFPVLGIVSAFTIAHSITLGLAALKIVSLPSSIIEPSIAVTIMLAALDNIWPLFPVPRIVVTFFFGLIHGFGFAGVLSELNLPTADFAIALLQFNVGLEMGQLIIVLVAVAVLFGLRMWSQYGRVVIRGGSVAAFALAALWFIERVANVSLLPF
jgi:hypothetical protein